jgi:DNA-directed RNA polymerase specialized sigma24 family protein
LAPSVGVRAFSVRDRFAVDTRTLASGLLGGMIGVPSSSWLTETPMPTDDAVTVWLGQLQAGESAAARPLWQKYFHRLVGLARARLKAAPRRAADEEDVALSAFDSFCRNAEAGRFPDLTDRDGLWRLLAAFTLRKAAHHLRDAGRLKRGGDADFDHHSGVFDAVIAREPDPALAAEVADECERMLGVLGNDELRRVALLRMDGYSVEEIAVRIECAPRSVKRKLGLIRDIWEREAAHEQS